MKTNPRGAVKIALGLLTLALLAAVLTFSVFLLMRRADGYFTFGAAKGFVAADDLMNAEGTIDAFSAGDMVYFSTDADFENGIAKGQIVLFRKSGADGNAISCRRVESIDKKRLSSGAVITTYRVKADNSDTVAAFDLAPNEIIGVFRSVSPSAGAFFTFLSSFVGFVLLILLPAFVGCGLIVFLLFSYLKNKS